MHSNGPARTTHSADALMVTRTLSLSLRLSLSVRLRLNLKRLIGAHCSSRTHFRLTKQRPTDFWSRVRTFGLVNNGATKTVRAIAAVLATEVIAKRPTSAFDTSLTTHLHRSLKSSAAAMGSSLIDRSVRSQLIRLFVCSPRPSVRRRPISERRSDRCL